MQWLNKRTPRYSWVPLAPSPTQLYEHRLPWQRLRVVWRAFSYAQAQEFDGKMMDHYLRSSQFEDFFEKQRREFSCKYHNVTWCQRVQRTDVTTTTAASASACGCSPLSACVIISLSNQSAAAVRAVGRRQTGDYTLINVFASDCISIVVEFHVTNRLVSFDRSQSTAYRAAYVSYFTYIWHTLWLVLYVLYKECIELQYNYHWVSYIDSR